MDQRRRGAFLMIIGANLIAGAVAMAVYAASLACVMGSSGCAGSLPAFFIDMMASVKGLAVAAAIVVGLLLIRRGKRMRQ